MAQTHAPLRIAVIGLGSIGGVVAAVLMDQGHEVLACLRRSIDSLTLDHPTGQMKHQPTVLTDPATVSEPVDWVLLCTKAQDTEAAWPWLQRLCGAGTRIAVLQNGVDHAARIAGSGVVAPVVPAIVYFNGERLAADHVRLRRVPEGDIAVPDDADGRAFTALFQGTEVIAVAAVADFITRAWLKLLINVAANPLTALTRQRQIVLRRPDIRALLLDVLEEAALVGRAEGAVLPPDQAEASLARLMTYPQEAGTSMYFDNLAGRPMEVEALTGAVVRAGERHGIPTPINRTIYRLLSAISDAAAAQQKG